MRPVMALLALLMLLTGTSSALARGSRVDPSYLIGTNLYFKGTSKEREAQQRARLAAVLSARAEAGDTAIILDIPIYQSGWDSSDVGAKAPDTPSAENLAWAVNEAHALGLAVLIKPLLDEDSIVKTGPAGAWRGTIQPADPAAWFASYQRLLESYLAIAGRMEGNWLIIGAEFGSLESGGYADSWKTLIDGLQATSTDYPVRLMYSQNWDRVGAEPSWFAALDGLAISVFFPLRDVSDDASVDELAVSMANYGPVLDQARDLMQGRPVIVGEVGIISSGVAYSNPWAWTAGSDAGINLEAQRRYAAAACDTYAPRTQGLFWWTLYINEPSNPTQDPGYSFEGKPAEHAVNACTAHYGRGAT